MKLLTEDELGAGLKRAPGWVVEGKTLVRTRTFADFVEAMRFVNATAEIAEAMGHHPDLDIRYNKVKLSLTTHDAGGITDLDLLLAERLGAL